MIEVYIDKQINYKKINYDAIKTVVVSVKWLESTDLHPSCAHLRSGVLEKSTYISTNLSIINIRIRLYEYIAIY